MTKLLNLAVSQVHVKYNALYHGQNDGLAMIPPKQKYWPIGGSKNTNLHIINYQKLTLLNKNNNGVFTGGQKKVT